MSFDSVARDTLPKLIVRREQMDERRVDERVDVEVEVRYRTIQEFLAAYSRNISGGGLFVRTPQPQPLNQQVQLRFTLPGLEHHFEMGGIVVWSNASPRSSFPPGMGIKFVQIAPDDVERIQEFVRNAGMEMPTLKKKTAATIPER
jgi:uncharacterized protein (TIGR02266 family)